MTGTSEMNTPGTRELPHVRIRGEAAVLRDFLILCALTFAAVLIHGYHLGIEDGAIYLPAIKRVLDPSLYPFGSEFFTAQTRPMLFDELVGWSAVVSHLSVDLVVFLWHLFSLFLLLLGCLRVIRLIFTERSAQWAGVALVMVLFTIPVAGTRLILVDQYLHPRSPATALLLLAAADILEGRKLRWLLWMALSAVIHPQMTFYGAILLVFWGWRRPPVPISAVPAGLAFPLSSFFDPPTEGWLEAMTTRTHYSLLRWHWSEWLGIVAPLLLLGWFARLGKRSGNRILEHVCIRTVAYSLLFFTAALLVTFVPALIKLAPVQPMRNLQIAYLLLFLVGGGFLGKVLLKNRPLRWILLLVPIALGMFTVQRLQFPAGEHIEWPGIESRNQWLQAFEWVSGHTARDALFALDPYYMEAPGEDQHGFRALAARSMLADRVKDAGPSALFPPIADAWRSQVHDLDGWKDFRKEDFRRLKEKYGVDWVVLDRSHPAGDGMSCPYENETVRVCRVE